MVQLEMTRRGFFDRFSYGLHGTALAMLLSDDLYGGVGPLKTSEQEPGLPEGHRRVYDLKPRASHFSPRATAVIHLFQGGGPSQVDLFDPKPMLDKHDGESYQLVNAQDINKAAHTNLLRSPFKFKQHGKSGIWLSEALPHLAEQVDDIAVIRSMYSVSFNHEQAHFVVQNGRPMQGRPSLGSWVVFGLGSEDRNLPAYVVLDDPIRGPINGVDNWWSGCLPPVYQGTPIRSTGSPLLDLEPESGKCAEMQYAERDVLAQLDRIHKRSRPGQLQLDARISSYELAARLQIEASNALDVNQETQATREAYGIGKEPTDSYGRRCLMARRLVERGVRFVQLFVDFGVWDHHSFIRRDLPTICQRTDQPVGALLQDLKQRGLLDSTLVIWNGEFGRMPTVQGNAGEAAGRDHNPRGFSLWMAGGGIKGGTVYGATDETGYQAVENKVSVADWHATILYTLGLDFKKLIFDQSGLKEKLTSVYEARVVKEILA